MSAPILPGKEMDFGGQKMVFPPLNATAVKQYREKINAVFVGGLPDIELVAQLAHCSLARNYPQLTLAQVEDWVDYGNMFEIWENLLNISGLVVQAGNMMRRVQDQMAANGLTK